MQSECGFCAVAQSVYISVYFFQRNGKHNFSLTSSRYTIQAQDWKQKSPCVKTRILNCGFFLSLSLSVDSYSQCVMWANLLLWVLVVIMIVCCSASAFCKPLNWLHRHGARFNRNSIDWFCFWLLFSVLNFFTFLGMWEMLFIRYFQFHRQRFLSSHRSF